MDFLTDGPADATHTLVLAHGAGAPMDHPFMSTIAESVAAHGIRVVRFEFPYMAARRTGGRRPPDRQAILVDTWREVVAQLGGGPGLVIGGKSMGGRIASMIADEEGVRGLVCLGYPFHPAGKPGQLRTAHLETLRTPALILQGERDTLGSCAEVETYTLSPAIRLRWLPDGDHSLKPRRASGYSEAEHLQTAADAIAAFVASPA